MFGQANYRRLIQQMQQAPRAKSTAGGAPAPMETPMAKTKKKKPLRTFLT